MTCGVDIFWGLNWCDAMTLNDPFTVNLSQSLPKNSTYIPPYMYKGVTKLCGLYLKALFAEQLFIVQEFVSTDDKNEVNDK